MAYERDNIRRLHAYTPGEQPQRLKVVKLNTNENPYPPCEAVMAAIRGVDAQRLRRYPPPLADGVRQAAAEAHGLTPDHILVTNGGDELLRLAVTVFCEPRPGSSAGTTPSPDSQTRPANSSHPREIGAAYAGQAHSGGGGGGGLGVAEPSYSLYPVLAAIQDTPLTVVELGEAFDLPADAAARWNQAGCRAAFIVNPHAPSGRLEPLEVLRRLAREFRGVLLIDEAYVDFAPQDALPLVREDLPNVLLLRSMSKGYSLAGLRLGYGIGSPGLIAAMHKVRDSYNVDALAQAAGEAALRHRDQARLTWNRVIRERDRVAGQLQQRGFTVWPSQSNFILVRPPLAGPDARTIYQRLADRGIFVRWFDLDRLRDKLRITIGTPEENTDLLEALGP